MIAGLERIIARRTWLVPDFLVWGVNELGDIDYLVIENVNGDEAVYYNSVGIEDSAQEVAFSSLVDHRGNSLPDSLESPVVIPRSCETGTVFITGRETSQSFRIARSSATDSPVKTDLLITEIGN